MFTEGGVLDMAKVAGNENALLAIFLVMIIGFGCKAGMMPLQAWLPTAHPCCTGSCQCGVIRYYYKSRYFRYDSRYLLSVQSGFLTWYLGAVNYYYFGFGNSICRLYAGIQRAASEKGGWHTLP